MASKYSELPEREKEKRRAAAKKWRDANLEKALEMNRKSRQKAKENGVVWPSEAPSVKKEQLRRFREKRNSDPVRREKYLENKRTWEKKNRTENGEIVRAYHNSWTRQNREKCRAYNEKRLSDPSKKEADREHRIQKRAWIKETVIDLYGGICACCGEDNIAFLSIDHVNNDGAEWRRKANKVSTHLYRILKKEGVRRDDLQVLCMNCNMAKYHFGVCPHQSMGREIVFGSLTPGASN